MYLTAYFDHSMQISFVVSLPWLLKYFFSNVAYTFHQVHCLFYGMGILIDWLIDWLIDYCANAVWLAAEGSDSAVPARVDSRHGSRRTAQHSGAADVATQSGAVVRRTTVCWSPQCESLPALVVCALLCNDVGVCFRTWQSTRQTPSAQTPSVFVSLTVKF